MSQHAILHTSYNLQMDRDIKTVSYVTESAAMQADAESQVIVADVWSLVRQHPHLLVVLIGLHLQVPLLY